jgi:ABC-type nitrate/sulfonate/bicarbonate transport system permease component
MRSFVGVAQRTFVAAELVAAAKGIGLMTAAKVLATDVVFAAIAMLAGPTFLTPPIVGTIRVPWKGKDSGVR